MKIQHLIIEKENKEPYVKRGDWGYLVNRKNNEKSLCAVVQIGNGRHQMINFSDSFPNRMFDEVAEIRDNTILLADLIDFVRYEWIPVEVELTVTNFK